MVVLSAIISNFFEDGESMGTSIHCFVEQKMYRNSPVETDRTGKWVSIDKWTKSDWAILYPEKTIQFWKWFGVKWSLQIETMTSLQS